MSGVVNDVQVSKTTKHEYSPKKGPFMIYIRRYAGGDSADVIFCGHASQTERSLNREQLVTMREVIDAALREWK